jgi:hypothetical protein
MFQRFIYTLLCLFCSLFIFLKAFSSKKAGDLNEALQEAASLPIDDGLRARALAEICLNQAYAGDYEGSAKSGHEAVKINPHDYHDIVRMRFNEVGITLREALRTASARKPEQVVVLAVGRERSLFD